MAAHFYTCHTACLCLLDCEHEAVRGGPDIVLVPGYIHRPNGGVHQSHMLD